MCGICGKYLFQNDRFVQEQTLREMNLTLVHRGPDDEGYYVNNNIGLAQRRLSIIDLKTGAQPLYNEDKSVVVVCNGEIYNYKELIKYLNAKNHRFSTNSDSEVIVHLYEEFGLEFASKLEGMFAIAIWDERVKRLVLCRDRAGIKPLFYYKDPEKIIFSSEIKAILKNPDIESQINSQALVDYFRFSFIPGPHSIFKKLFKLEPGCFLVAGGHDHFSIKKYWNLKLPEHTQTVSENETVANVYQLIERSVAERLMSDVPFGCFLSGGIDSSIVAAFMTKTLDQPVKTFSIGFDNEEYNELDKARVVANALKADHHEFVVSPDIEEITKKLAIQYDEPFADPSAIPTYLVSKMASDHVKMCLSGDGGDELFGGYTRYLPFVKPGLNGRIPGFIKKLSGYTGQILPFGIRGKTRLHLISLNRKLRYIESGFSVFTQDLQGALFKGSFKSELADYNSNERLVYLMEGAPDFINQMGFFDFSTYLVDSNLQKVDRASMLNSLEVRVPLIDRRIIEYAFTIPGSLKIPNGNLKSVLKNIVSSVLPPEIARFPKKGFSVPIRYWLRNELVHFAEEVINSDDNISYDYIDKNFIQKLFKMHKLEKIDVSRMLWTAINFELWARNYLRCG